ncbi:MAG TPA: Uma2 family endonuclease [Promineifilum sp.]|nr:Uma2 family endonuclease [Promineifilum sp.]
MIAERVETKPDIKTLEAETAKVELKRRRFTAADFLRMTEVGVFKEDERLELLWGEIAEMSPINVAHVLCVNRLNAILSEKLAAQAIVSVQNPVQLDDQSLPQPDVALWKPAIDEYSRSSRLPGPSELLLVIEVADTSIGDDRRVKATLYSRAGIADYWIVNLRDRVIEVYREPRPDGYRTMTRYAPGETLSPLAFADVALNVAEILGTSD